MSHVWDNFTNEKQWREYISRLLKTNDKALDKAIVLIYNNQTLEEQALEQSSEENKVGFTKWDAKYLSGLAKALENGNTLSESDRAIARNKMVKYWKQLMYISKRQMEERDAKQLEAISDTHKRVQAKQQFQYDIELMRKCSEQGIQCGYGICDECPVTQGFQMRLNVEDMT